MVLVRGAGRSAPRGGPAAGQPTASHAALGAQRRFKDAWSALVCSVCLGLPSTKAALSAQRRLTRWLVCSVCLGLPRQKRR